MDAARALVRAGRLEIKAVRAQHQTNGRGRRGTEWSAAPGESLLITYLGQPVHPDRFSPQRYSFGAGAAVAEVLSEGYGLTPCLKWPNDILVDGRKISGVLVETAPTPSGMLVPLIGIGLNANTRHFPAELEGSATSIAQQAGDTVDVELLEERLRSRLFMLLTMSWEEIFNLWKRWDDTAGRRYSAEMDSGMVQGTAAGVLPDGRLEILLYDGSAVVTWSATSH